MEFITIQGQSDFSDGKTLKKADSLKNKKYIKIVLTISIKIV